jgi:hypothetical protein
MFDFLLIIINQLDLEIFRLGFVLIVLIINTVTDLKERVIFGSDKVNLIFGIVGVSLFFIDSVDSFFVSLFMLVINVTVILLMWRFKMVASGDIIILLIFAVTVPIISNWVLLPLFTIILSMVFLMIYSLIFNMTLNSITLFNHQHLFGMYRVSTLKKIISFGLVHQRRGWEKHSISVEQADGFSLTTVPFGKEFSRKNELVASANPLIPFLLVSFVIIVITVKLS